MATQRVPAPGWRRIGRDALLLALASSALGLAVNALRPAGLPLLADRHYDILVPCPETLGEVAALPLADLRLDAASDLVVDARAAVSHTAWHVDGAVSVPFDVLEPVQRDVVEALLERPARRVIVYGDVVDGLDQGYELGRELSGRGLRRVHVVRGDSAALRAHLQRGGPP